MDIDELLIAYLTNNATQAQLDELLQWVKSSDENQNEFTKAVALWHNINEDKFNTDKALEQFNTHKNQRKNISIWKRLSTVAAVALIAIISISILNKTKIEMQSITNQNLQEQMVLLPDGSQIFLQKNASVVFPETFDADKRNISTTGNVFCQIARNENAPFTLTSGDLSVRVLGTAFQVNTIDSTYVIVKSGKVQVSYNDQLATLIKGERVDITNDSQIVTSTNNDVNYLSWKTDTLLFRNANLNAVYADIARHFNCNFNIASNCDVQNLKLTGTYANCSLAEALQLIELTIPQIHYELQGNEVLVSLAK